ncbi:MAG: hypothetical protein GX474_09555, partial [Bacteroidales bacterium]|nr:hypothetical protein [Bacteroidales bacterium]
MKKLTRILLLLAVSCSTPDYFKVQDLNTGWEFWKDQEPEATREVFLPHTPQLEPYVVNNQWQGICWYR